MVVTTCLTAKPHPDWSLVTEPSAYTSGSCSRLFSWLRSWISDSILPAGHSQQRFTRSSGSSVSQRPQSRLKYLSRSLVRMSSARSVSQRPLNWFKYLSHSLVRLSSRASFVHSPSVFAFFIDRQTRRMPLGWKAAFCCMRETRKPSSQMGTMGDMTNRMWLSVVAVRAAGGRHGLGSSDWSEQWHRYKWLI